MRISRGYLCASLAVVALVGASASASPDPIASSTFDDNDEGWTVVTTLGYTGPVNYEATGGNPGGFIWAADPDTGAWAFRAPAKFLGDVSDAYGDQLTFDIASNNPVFPSAWVGIEGGGYQFVCPYDAPALPNVVYGRAVTFSDTGGWVNPINLQPATGAQLLATLSDLDAMIIVAEFADGTGNNDVSALDNVVLLPEPVTLALLAAAVPLMLRRRRRGRV